MYCATFIYATGQFDDAFERLNAQIAEAAREIPGYLGEESWENPANGLGSTVYYWESLEALQQLMQHPGHLLAKQRQGEWLAGYQVVVSEVRHIYGDGRLAALLPVGPHTAGAPGRGI